MDRMLARQVSVVERPNLVDRRLVDEVSVVEDALGKPAVFLDQFFNPQDFMRLKRIFGLPAQVVQKSFRRF